MRNPKKIIKNELEYVLQKTGLSTKIKFYFSSKTAGDDFDPYEKNYIDTKLNPIAIKAYVREITPEALVWKQYGLANIGAKEIICDKKYIPYFKNAARIEIDGDLYQVYKEGTGNNAVISKRPFDQIRVVVSRLN